MIDVHNAMKAEGVRSKMLLQVHDELVFDVHQSEIDLMKELIYNKMTQAVDMGVPMEVEVGMGKNWLEAH